MTKYGLEELVKNTFHRIFTKPGYRVVATALVILFAYNYALKENQYNSKQTKLCIECHNRKSQMTEYFKKSGNQTPEEMAVAVLTTKSPRLLAAIAVKGEKNTPYTVRKGGFKKRHAGSWQVNKAYWGEVPKDPIGQALQAENILIELTNEMPIKKALNLYGGDSKGRYANKVFAELVNVP